VAEHSNYRTDPWARLYRTLDLTTQIVFGSREEADEAARRIWHVHGRVHGTTAEDSPGRPRGTPYDARQPDLLLWVHATLVMTALEVHDRYVAPVSREDRERYYQEQKLLAERFGVPREHQPDGYADFVDYFQEMVERELAVTGALRDVIDAVLRPELPAPLRPLAWPVVGGHRLVTVGLLPPTLRDALGLEWGPRRRALLERSQRLARGLLPLLPSRARDFPRARAADRRLAAAR
jgi:uncharacterized protein (DUF2236 family)